MKNTMNKQNLVLSGVVLAVVLSLVSLLAPKQVVNQPNQFGAVATLDGVDSPNVSIGGLRTQWLTSPLLATSSRICNVRNTTGKTAQILSLGLQLTDGILGANTFSIATGSTPYSTSTQYFIFEEAIASDATGSWAWQGPAATTTASSRNLVEVTTNGDSNAIVTNGQYIVWSLATTTAGSTLSDYMDGTCSAVIRVL